MSKGTKRGGREPRGSGEGKREKEANGRERGRRRGKDRGRRRGRERRKKGRGKKKRKEEGAKRYVGYIHSVFTKLNMFLLIFPGGPICSPCCYPPLVVLSVCHLMVATDSFCHDEVVGLQPCPTIQ